ncbi:HNH endonuclease [Agrobacterium tumefaciens]|uniref:HNH endonuclease n=1 Tax=Agrobacterium tumefaciens TaxID=358 RepID=UPI0012DA20A2|nr:HNH endonuclease signature motif containing protein [Agrobacterium tumefaciens]
MRNLPLPGRGAVRSDLEKALSTWTHNGETKGYAASPQQVEELLLLYDQYDTGNGKPTAQLKGEALDDALLKATHDAFDQLAERRRLGFIRKELMAEIDRCPICGILPVRELDHFLPRSKYKALSIYRRNLVPLCHDCNNIKSNRAGGEAGDFVHAYFDRLPDRDLIVADTVIRGNILDISFRVVDDLDIDQTIVLKLRNQLSTLKLSARFRREINTYLSSLACSLHILWGTLGENGVRILLEKQIITEIATHHRNDWRVATLRSVADNPSFCSGGFRDVYPQVPGAPLL